MRLILEFSTRIEAQTCLGAIDAMAADYWVEQGYTVTNGQLIGKKNGVDNPSAARTLTWDAVEESPDGTFYFSSLTGTPFEAGMDQLSAAFTFTEKEIPEAWLPDEG
tara:strand:- start:206 stop:526 length:321 start_codon:yes stop_codon:yes gene_type:complete